MSEYISVNPLRAGSLAILQHGRQITTFKGLIPHRTFDNAIDILLSHLPAYSNPNYTTWEQAGYNFPRNSQYNGC